MQHKVLIIGGGLAGLTSAIHLLKQSLDVTLIEKDTYPHHKVCGEYVSNEVLPYLQWLGADPMVLNPAEITHLEFSIESGKNFSAKLPLGGFGLSRYAFDKFLYDKAVENGCNIVCEQAMEVRYADNTFQVITASGNLFPADIVLAAYGKRSVLDIKMERNFTRQKSPWLAVKEHYKGIHAGHIVGLHCFDGGYCGVSKTENGNINICYLVTFDSFKKYKDIKEHREQVLFKNPALDAVFKDSIPLFEKPLTISQISFERKDSVENHILMIGDTAGLIHPLCGNGMAMAIHSAKLASEAVIAYANGKLSRQEMEEHYTKGWNHIFSRRIKTGKWITSLLQKPSSVKLASIALAMFPQLLNIVIKRTHGKPIIATPAYEYEISE
jgi:flavin-dependent dehydrogenase